MSFPNFLDALGYGPSQKRIAILRGISLTGSISQAARDAGISYKAAWNAITALTKVAKVPLVEGGAGGSRGGGTRLTQDGLRLLELADAFEDARCKVFQRWRESKRDLKH